MENWRIAQYAPVKSIKICIPDHRSQKNTGFRVTDCAELFVKNRQISQLNIIQKGSENCRIFQFFYRLSVDIDEKSGIMTSSSGGRQQSGWKSSADGRVSAYECRRLAANQLFLFFFLSFFFCFVFLPIVWQGVICGVSNGHWRPKPAIPPAWAFIISPVSRLVRNMHYLQRAVDFWMALIPLPLRN